VPTLVRRVCSTRVVGQGSLQLRIMAAAGGINTAMPSPVYEKTLAGRLALQSRASGLSLEVRRVLILTNGVKTVSDLREIVDPAQLDSAITSLLNHNYIQLVSEHDACNFDWIKKEASRFTSLVLGPMSSAMCEAIGRCESSPELRKVLRAILIFVDARLSPDTTARLEKHYRAMLLLSSIDIPLP